MAIALSAYALVVAKLANLSLEDTQSFLACTILGMALATVLQSWGGKVGAGAFIVHIPDPIMVPFIALVITSYGLGGVLPATVLAGCAALLVGRVVPHLRPLFPPTVMGVVVTVGGFSLVRGALEHSLGLDDKYHHRSAEPRHRAGHAQRHRRLLHLGHQGDEAVQPAGRHGGGHRGVGRARLCARAGALRHHPGVRAAARADAGVQPRSSACWR